MPCSKPSQSISSLSLIKNQIPWIISLSYFHYMKNIHFVHMLPFSNMLQYKNIYVLYCIVTLAAVIIFFFLKIISLINSVNTSFMGKEKVYIFHIYFSITTLYICICFLFFNNAKRPRGVPFQILLRVMLFGALTSRDSYNCFCRWSWLGWWDFKIIGAAPITFWLVILVKNYYSM